MTSYQDQVHSRGLRATPARMLVLEVLDELHHATAEQVFAGLEGRRAGLSLSTVYRNLETLAAKGIVSHTHVADGAKAYQLTSQADHAHLVCRACQAVTEIPHRLTSPFVDRIRTTTGFEVDTGHMSVFGRCEQCARTVT